MWGASPDVLPRGISDRPARIKFLYRTVFGAVAQSEGLGGGEGVERAPRLTPLAGAPLVPSRLQQLYAETEDELEGVTR